MKLVSWNVAGLRACIKKGFIDFFKTVDADIFCLQEVKATKEQIDFDADGYYEYLFPAEKKGYSGTLIYTKEPIDVCFGIDNPNYDIEGRTITLEFEKFYVVNVYVPNVKRDLSRLEDRMNFEEEFKKYLTSLARHKAVIVCGDFNVAHTEFDIKNAKQNIGNAGFTYEEREKFTELLASGFIDTFRYFHPGKPDYYTWWSYMRNVRARNIGWRIDYFLVSKDFIKEVKDAIIYSDILGSDHCPIGLEIK